MQRQQRLPLPPGILIRCAIFTKITNSRKVNSADSDPPQSPAKANISASMEASLGTNEPAAEPTVSATLPQAQSLNAQTTLTLSLGSAKDRENTQRRYENALEELKKALKDAGGVWEEKFKTAK